jgi:hypothetical protein
MPAKRKVHKSPARKTPVRRPSKKGSGHSIAEHLAGMGGGPTSAGHMGPTFAAPPTRPVVTTPSAPREVNPGASEPVRARKRARAGTRRRR